MQNPHAKPLNEVVLLLDAVAGKTSPGSTMTDSNGKVTSLIQFRVPGDYSWFAGMKVKITVTVDREELARADMDMNSGGVLYPHLQITP